MTYMVVLVGAIALLSFLTIWSAFNRTNLIDTQGWLRTSVIAYAIILMGVAPFTFYELLGRPKPLTIESLPLQTTVVSFVLDGQERVHLTVQSPAWDTPRLVSLVWEEKLVKKLVEQRQRAATLGRELGIKTHTTGDPTDVFYVLTPSPAPPKK